MVRIASIGRPYGYSASALVNRVTVVATVTVEAAVTVFVTVTVVVGRGRMVKLTQPMGLPMFTSPSTLME